MTDRKAYQDKVEAQLKAWNADLEKLTAKALKADADGRIELSKRVESLREHYRTVQDRFVGMVAAGDEVFGEAQDQLERAADALKRLWKEARSEFESTAAAAR